MQGAKAIKQAQVKGKSKKTASVSNLVKLDAAHPIPLDNGRAFQFINNVSYLPFFAPRDRFAQDLIEARVLSTTHNSCIVTKKDYCAGDGGDKGVNFEDADGKDFTPEMELWLESMNLKNDSSLKINKKIFEDLFTLGNVPIVVVRFKVAGTPKLFLYPQNLLEWRLCKPNADDIVEEAVQSKLFLRDRLGFITAEDLKNSLKLPLYNPLKTEKENWIRDSKGVERTLIWYKSAISGMPYYGLPTAIASLVYQILEYKGARYNLDLFDNEMVASALLALKGNLSQAEADRIANQAIATHTGDGRRGRVIVVASEEGIEGSDYHKMETTKDGSYTDADEKWTQKIILANQWDSVLAGIISPSTLGKGSNFLTKIEEIKFKKVIRPLQADAMAEVWRHIFKIAEQWLGLPFSQYTVRFKNAVDISGLTDIDITAAVQVNEVREAKGLKPDPKMEGVYMSTSKVPPPLEDPNNPGNAGGPPDPNNPQPDPNNPDPNNPTPDPNNPKPKKGGAK